MTGAGNELTVTIPALVTLAVMKVKGADVNYGWATGARTCVAEDGERFALPDLNIGGRTLYLDGAATATVYFDYYYGND